VLLTILVVPVMPSVRIMSQLIISQMCTLGLSVD